MPMQEDKQIVTRSMVILFLAMTIVYSLVYMRKVELFTYEQVQSPDMISEGVEAPTVPTVYTTEGQLLP